MGRYLYDIETPSGKPVGTAQSIKKAREVAQYYVATTGKRAVILREGRDGRVSHVEDWATQT